MHYVKPDYLSFFTLFMGQNIAKNIPNETLMECDVLHVKNEMFNKT